MTALQQESEIRDGKMSDCCMQVCKFAFKNGKVHFQNKYVRTEAMLKEQAAGKMLYRGVFSVGNPAGGKFFNPFNFTVKGVANTGVLHWGDRLLALYEVSTIRLLGPVLYAFVLKTHSLNSRPV